MLQEIFSADGLVESLRKGPLSSGFHPFPPASDRASWERAASGTVRAQWRDQTVGAAEALLPEPWPELTAAMFMDYIRRGFRVTYETPYFARRNRLGLMVLAECLEYRGRFLEAIVEGIWQMVNEVDWCLPAHSEYLPGDPLPKPYTARVDLFCAVSGMVLAETFQLLGPELTRISPSLMELLRGETVRRVVEPVERYAEGHWWLDGFNNWTPWCSSNVLGCALTFLDDPVRVGKLAGKLLRANDRFIANYPADGGCDEGPMYWGAAPGKLLVLLELLDYATGGGYGAVFREPLIRNMGEYITRVHLCREWFLSAADSCARVQRLAIGTIYRYGERVGSKAMRQLASASIFNYNPAAEKAEELDFKHCGDLLTYKLREWFWLPTEIANGKLENQGMTRLPDLQIFISREHPGATDRGLILSLKGGHNGESHNHNDLGQFELFCDGLPVVVDAGVGAYTRQTFSDRRYELWYIGSQGHNVPEINGIRQMAGTRYRAVLTGEAVSANSSLVQLNLAGAYPDEAGIASYVRSADFDRKKRRAIISDRLVLKQGPLAVTIPLYCAVKPERIDAEHVRFVLPNNTVSMRLSGGMVFAEPEEVAIDDDRLAVSWGERLYLLRLNGDFASGQGEWALTFSMAHKAE